jgi:phosphatidylinositol glycan class B
VTRAYLLLSLAIVCVTAVFSYAYFHIDENFQILEWVWWKLGLTEKWTLPWEHTMRMRPWMQVYFYYGIAKALGIRDTFRLAFVFRLVTGLASWGALVLFVKTTLPWLEDDRERRLHLRVATLLGFLPYLFVRTSSETFAMAAFTAAWAIVLYGATSKPWKVSPSIARLAISGALIGIAFEARFQSAILSLGLLAWLVIVGRVRARIVVMILPALAVVGLGVLVDRWGYGEWTFPAWTYLKANLFEGAAAMFGSEPPFAYLWLTPANLFFPVVIALFVMMVVAWIRNPRHPVTWATLPFFLVHNLLSHKEERFLFPMAILATAFVTMSRIRRPRIVGWGLAVWSTAFMWLLAAWPIGWHHHVRFQKYVHDAMNGELRTYALPEYDLGLPAFHGRVYDIEKASPEDIAKKLESGGAREWLVADTPRLHTGVAGLDGRATLVWSEEPFAGAYELAQRYDAIAKPPLRPLRFRSLYRLDVQRQ